MANISNFQLGGINTYVNPLAQNDGQLIHAVNVDSDPMGGKATRTGLQTYNSSLSAQVNTLFSWTKNDGTTLFTYAAAGSLLYYSLQGTGAWTIAGNGTIGAGAHVAYDVLDDTLLIVDGVGSTRHTTNGTAFTNTTLAPVGVDVCEYQNRMYIAGTSSDLFYSSANDATNWSTSGTSDSSSLKIPGGGKLSKIFKTADRIFATKNTGIINKWDGFSRADLATNLGPSSPYSFAKTEDYCFWINGLGHQGFGGDRPELLSNAVEKQFYNTSGSAVAGTQFASMPAGVHRYDYLATLGTITDDFVGITIPDAVLRYDYQKNEYLNWRFHVAPTAYHSFKDVNGNQTLLIGDATGQVYKQADNVYSDNTNPIPVDMIFLNYGTRPDLDKEWKKLDVFFNPGCEAVVQYAVSNSLDKASLRWLNLGDVTAGKVRFRFDRVRGHFLFLRVIDNSTTNRMVFYGYNIDFDYVDP